MAAARAAADGSTLLFVADPVIPLHLVVKRVQFDMPRDFAAITQVTTQPIAVAVHSSVPVKSVHELIAYAKANPGKLAFGFGQGIFKIFGDKFYELLSNCYEIGING